MKVLLTGAFGSLGSLVLEALLRAGHTVLAHDLQTKLNARLARAYARDASVTVRWGDIRDAREVSVLVGQVEAVIHLAAVVVPASELHSELAYAVNVSGTEHIVEAIRTTAHKPLLVYCSSLAVFGPQAAPPPRTLSETPIATDHYTRHKLACEQLVQRMQSPWVILRLGGMADSRLRNRSLAAAKYALSMAGQSRFEYVHPRDAATAFVNALTETEAHNRIHLIGGGSTCQVTHRDVMNATLGAFGIMLGEADFGDGPFYADWADTAESQRLLRFQQHSFEDFRQENYEAFKAIRPVVRPFAPAIRTALRLLTHGGSR